jgi:hypothetical protein
VAGCKFPRLQLRGSAGFSPASLPVKADKDAQTKEVVKELNWIVGKIYSLATVKVNLLLQMSTSSTTTKGTKEHEGGRSGFTPSCNFVSFVAVEFRTASAVECECEKPLSVLRIRPS